jgi:hypothetical protein
MLFKIKIASSLKIFPISFLIILLTFNVINYIFKKSKTISLLFLSKNELFLHLFLFNLQLPNNRANRYWVKFHKQDRSPLNKGREFFIE